MSMTQIFKKINSSAYLLLEFVIYLAVSVLLLLFVGSFLINSVKFDKKLERLIATDCALHNACILFQRDQAIMPQRRSHYIYLQADKLSFLDVQKTATISWYFDKQRFMRSSKRAGGTEHAVVLAPANGSIEVQHGGDLIYSLKLALTHNIITQQTLLWLK